VRKILALPLLPALCGLALTPVLPKIQTDAVTGNPDDPAIWVHPKRSELSLVIGTTKLAAPDGALVVFDLNGKTVQSIPGIDRPNNVDVEYGLPLGGRRADIAAVTARNSGTLWIFEIDAKTRRLRDISGGGIRVFQGEPGRRAAPMGVALYKRKRDGAIFAILSRKEGPKSGYLWQYRIEGGESGPRLTKVREFGAFSGTGEIEAIVADDELGYVYYADEGAGIRKWRADPDAPDAGRELAVFGQSGYQGDREGLAIHDAGRGRGYLVSTDQIAGGSRFLFYRREGAAENPHDHAEVVKTVQTTADSTDGLEICSRSLGPELPRGLAVAMNNAGNNFFYFDWAAFSR
jgi:3-phytase